MKKIITRISALAIALAFGTINVHADNAYITTSGAVHNQDGHSGEYFTWHWNYGTGAPNANAKGLILTNATDTHGGNVITVHCIKDGNRYRFYCDEACKIELVGIGYTSGWSGYGINWGPVCDVNDAIRFDTDVSSTGIAGDAKFTGTSNDYCNLRGVANHESELSSPKDLSEFFFMISNGFKSIGDNGAPRSPKLAVTVIMHDTYVVPKTEWNHRTGNFQGHDIIMIDYSSTSFCTHADAQLSSVTLKRYDSGISGSDSDHPIISLEPSYEYGETDSRTYYLNFNPGKIILDNNTTNDDDVAIRVGHNALFMDVHMDITNSASGYHGVGVKLAAGENDMNYHNASIELGNDQQGGGTSKIRKQAIGIDAYAGVIRLKQSTPGNPIDITDNAVAASIAHGVMLGKWADDISSFTGNDVLITLKDPQEWRAGDIVFASGRTKVANGYPSNVDNEYYAFLTESEASHLQYAPETDLSKRFMIFFDPSGTPENVDYEFPVFRLDLQCIYNPRTKNWYNSLYDALNDSGTALNGENKAIADNDELIYFGNVLEPKAVTVNNNIYIRSAYKYHGGDRTAASESGRDPDDITDYYVSTYNGSGETFITVAEGKTLTIGNRTGSGIFSSYTIDMDGKGRGLDVYGRVNMYGAYPSGVGLWSMQSIINGHASGNGGAVKIESTGTLEITNVEFRNNTASGNGEAIYQGGTMYISETPSFDNSDYVYLPESHVITKAGSFSVPYEKPIPVKLANEASGRDILVSMEEASNSLSGQVESSDGSKLSVTLEDPLFSVIYNATGLDGGIYTPTDVIELFLGNGKILIIKDGLKTGDSAVFTVTAAGGANPSYTVVLTGIDDSGSQVQQAILEVPVNTYTVTESGWSWAYQNVSGTSASVTKSIAESQAAGVYSEFRFSNEAKSGTTEHAESSKNNEFN